MVETLVKRNDQTFWRQLGLVTPAQLAKIDVTMIGVGGLGSPTAMGLAKMGINHFTLYDDDVVDEHNVPNQMYTLRDVGKPKVEAIGDVIEAMGSTFTAHFERYENQTLSGVVIMTPDSMASRQAVWDSAKYSPSIPLLIDARMSAEEGRIFAVKPYEPDDIAYFEDFLYSDEEADELPCTERSIIYNTFEIASRICRIVKELAVGGENIPRQMITDSIQYAVYPMK